ncbi:1,6-anhydro-N-acetylmuramyl-L-alanine amidase AmpD [Undibacterium sp. Jales W-56]|uniref:1,6-anhydro-N-acetylmuramyl-L-alanine amidase AmpD n=1 Tax=Undibacterium sp. Jales W-56 TaxID=2897325 RepID=UPI0021CFA698|nr:1,6-anhydro-N-acetylmuramyl-L-alanine amidase AmpD [Undibacterium sp. Jales W-56]MCU6432366.1 1,6-anhydro-N-acetylmuramyl-L-alanine amidase AmpD [Undibacterium sp. Jales W-56]
MSRNKPASSTVPAAYTIDAGGNCLQAVQRPSPNYDRRPDGTGISLLVIHNISLPAGQFGGSAIADLFLNQLDFAAHPDFISLQGVRVSTHFLIRRDGQLLQFVPAGLRAWHAGVSSFQGRSACNDFSVGIELEGTDQQAFEKAQYQALYRLTLALIQRYPIQHIVGHQDIAPGRKTDPGPHFDWKQYKKLLTQAAQQASMLVPTHALPSFPFML